MIECMNNKLNKLTKNVWRSTEVFNWLRSTYRNCLVDMLRIWQISDDVSGVLSPASMESNKKKDR